MICGQLGMHMTQVATMNCGLDCWSRCFHACAGNAHHSIGSRPRAWYRKPSPGFDFAAERLQRQPHAHSSTIFDTGLGSKRKILGLPESSAYPLELISEATKRLAPNVTVSEIRRQGLALFHRLTSQSLGFRILLYRLKHPAEWSRKAPRGDPVAKTHVIPPRTPFRGYLMYEKGFLICTRSDPTSLLSRDQPQPGRSACR